VRRCWLVPPALPIHVVNLIQRRKTASGLAMAIEAPLHQQRVRLKISGI